MMRNVNLIKCLLLGSSGVGKSALINKYANDVFNTHFITTIGVDYKIKLVTVAEKEYRLQIWDTASQERFRCITHNYYKNTNIIIICFDTCSPGSFDDLEYWIKDYEKYLNPEVSVIKVIVGTKTDLINLRKVDKEYANCYALKKNMKYYEVSSKYGIGIDILFENIINEYINTKINVDNVDKEYLEIDKIDLNNTVMTGSTWSWMCCY